MSRMNSIRKIRITHYRQILPEKLC